MLQKMKDSFVGIVRSSSDTIQSLEIPELICPQPTSEKRKYVRFGVIDDERFQPLENLIYEGYDVAYIGNHCRIEACSPYHCILCDLANVGCDLSQTEQGAAVIREIKRLYPEKYVIVYSGLDRRHKPLRAALDIADAHLPKSASLELCHTVMDSAVEQVLSPAETWKRVRSRLQDREVPSTDIVRLEQAFVKSVKKGTPEPLKSVIRQSGQNDTVRSVAINLVSSAIWTAMIGGI
jgi:hypothetical protein